MNPPLELLSFIELGGAGMPVLSMPKVLTNQHPKVSMFGINDDYRDLGHERTSLGLRAVRYLVSCDMVRRA